MPDDLPTTRAEYGIVLPPHLLQKFNAMQPDTFAALRNNRGVFQPVINGTPNSFLQLAQSIHRNGAAGLDGRVDDFVFLNRDLGANLLALPNLVTHLQISELRAAYGLITPLLRPYLRTFYQARNAPTKLRDLIGLSAPIGTPGFVAAQDGILTTLCTIVRQVRQEIPMYAGNYPGIARPAMAHLNRMRIAHPPGGGFTGFAQWGEGNHHSVAANQKWHFLKHVCYIDDGEGGLDAFDAGVLVMAVAFGAGVQEAAGLLEAATLDDAGPVMAEECAAWWRSLNIRLPWAECTARIHDPVELDRIRPWFTGGVLSHGYVEPFILSGVLSRCPQVLAYLMQNYQNAYTAYAMARSAQLDEAIVSSNGAKVFIAGSRGDDFIIGRLDATGVLGISSCYKPANLATKMEGAMDGFMWRLI